MKQYEYVPVAVSKWNGTIKTDYRAMIDEYAQMGYRYVGFLPTRQKGKGYISQMDLIFEKDR